ncbi:MAG: UDP-2,3-diacylglucosamine pyrophosphatase [Magnetovibrio sp.]|nr:UDP-2,3-diacylglucosamine pyrophosphatase [Magnetovibrio sp.]|tara:strand:- start:321 stop:1160 length:840 start_codon:yes stop_codon:yes gene_type:complete
MLHKIGIIAGAGNLPIILAHECLKLGLLPFVIVLKGQANSGNYSELPNAVFRMGAIGSVIRRLRIEGINNLAFAGHVRKPTLLELQPDTWTAKFIARSKIFHHGDNTLLSALIRELEKEDFRIHGVNEIIPDLITPPGCLTIAKPTKDNETDIHLGIEKASKIGRSDIGQAVVVSKRSVIAEEDERGTDKMLCNLVGNKFAVGGVLVKIIKPGQDQRVDLPTMGPTTVKNAISAKLSGIALSAGTSLILQKTDVITASNKAKIFLVGLKKDTVNIPLDD